MRMAIIASTFISMACWGQNMSLADDATDVPVAAPMDTEFAAKEGEVAVQSVMRVQCLQQNSAGTCFLHKSGRLITAEHVVRNCSEVSLILANGTRVTALVEAADADFDVALLNPKTAIAAPALPISSKPELIIGTPVSTWGFPSGYGWFETNAKRRLPLRCRRQARWQRKGRRPKARIAELPVSDRGLGRRKGDGPALQI